MATMAKEKPILFSAPMVRAILAGTKTQTRRVIKPQPEKRWNHVYGTTFCTGDHPRSERCIGDAVIKCPYEVGMRLWIKTGYATRYNPERDETVWSLPNIDGRFVTTHGRAYSKSGKPKKDGNHPGMFMPFWLSQELRLPELEITDVRVERVADISEEDALAEGIDDAWLVKNHSGPPRALNFRWLWDEINGAKAGHAWADNPFCWAISFNREEAT